MGAHIKIALSLIQEENVVIRKSVRQCQLEVLRSDFIKPALYEDEDKSANVIELSRFKEKNCQPSALSGSEILLQGNVSTDTLESVRDPFIQKYRQTQGNTVYLKSKPSFEISI